jgi:hypothetical protein
MSSYGLQDHIAITSGNKSTTRREVSVGGCPVAPCFGVTQGDSSDTFRRIGQDSEILPRDYRPAHKNAHPLAAGLFSCDGSSLDTVSNLPPPNRDIGALFPNLPCINELSHRYRDS